LCGDVGCIRERRTWYTKAQARPVKAKTTTKVPGPFVVTGPEGWPGPERKPSQHSTLFVKIAIFAECCDGFYCKAKSTTKVPGPFVVEVTFAQIKPAKINLSLFGRF